MARQDGETLEQWRARAQAELDAAIAESDSAVAEAVDEVPIGEIDEQPEVQATEEAVEDAVQEVIEADNAVESATSDAVAEIVAEVSETIEEAAEDHGVDEDDVAARVRQILADEYGLTPSVAEVPEATVTVAEVEPDVAPRNPHWSEKSLTDIFRR